jgi:hypothetical protein
MAVGEGKFVLYSRIEPPLQAGEYRFTATQELTATGLNANQLPVAALPAYVNVRAPRYTLPPDQVLSTFPPAGSEGSYGSRLPQVVIRRRTLPWERQVQEGVPKTVPWLALVLIAEGEAELKLNQPVAQCVTPGKSLPGKADVELGNYLQIRRSMMDKVFPTRLDVPLLAHAREVDIHDTELMMGDDDGFLAVVISNRLPLPGRDQDGDAVPVKYLACLVNLEGQFTELIEKAPEPAPFTVKPNRAVLQANVAQWDHVKMGVSPKLPDVPMKRAAAAPSGSTYGSVTAVPNSGAAAMKSAQQESWSSKTQAGVADVYAEMARDFGESVVTNIAMIDPVYRFPVLLHWSFTSHGSVTFRSLMEGLDSGLLGTVPEEPATDGRAPLEVVETGHTGLAHRTRRGDPVRSWYRGPFVPHPTTDPPGGRLPLAHAADQLRIVVPDGREDISIAAAFEIGRLLALSRPSMIAALMRWRQSGYQTARRGALWAEHAGFLGEMLGLGHHIDRHIGVQLGRGLIESVILKPEDFMGDPAPLVAAGRALPLDGTPERLLAQGFGLSQDVLEGDALSVLQHLRDTPVMRPDAVHTVTPEVQTVLADTLVREVGRLVAGATVDGSDALDRLIAGLEEVEES